MFADTKVRGKSKVITQHSKEEWHAKNCTQKYVLISIMRLMVFCCLKKCRRSLVLYNLLQCFYFVSVLMMAKKCTRNLLLFYAQVLVYKHSLFHEYSFTTNTQQQRNKCTIGTDRINHMSSEVQAFQIGLIFISLCRDAVQLSGLNLGSAQE